MLLISYESQHRVKSVRIQSYSGPHFSRIFGIHTKCGEIRSNSPYSVRMRENAEKVLTRKTPNTDTFYAVQKVIAQSPDTTFAKNNF